MTEEDMKAFNCEQFEDLRIRWQLGTVDKDTIRRTFPSVFPENWQKILAWLDRPIVAGALSNVNTMEKFDE